MAGDNAILSIRNFGRRHVIVSSISLGLEMNVTDSAMSRTGRMFQTYKVTSGTIQVKLAFNSHASHEQFMKWLTVYLRRVNNPDLPTEPIRFICPVRDIDKHVILMGGIEFGDVAGQHIYPANLTFKEVAEYKNLTDFNGSIFQLSESDDPALPYLYPSGTQLGGRLGEGNYDAASPIIMPRNQ